MSRCNVLSCNCAGESEQYTTMEGKGIVPFPIPADGVSCIDVRRVRGTAARYASASPFVCLRYRDASLHEHRSSLPLPPSGLVIPPPLVDRLRTRSYRSRLQPPAPPPASRPVPASRRVAVPDAVRCIPDMVFGLLLRPFFLLCYCCVSRDFREQNATMRDVKQRKMLFGSAVKSCSTGSVFHIKVRCELITPRFQTEIFLLRHDTPLIELHTTLLQTFC